MKKLIFIALFVSVALFQRAAACTCIGYPAPNEALSAADVVIIGYVKKTEPENNEGYVPQVAYVKVEKAFKGYDEDEIILHQPGHSCSPTYKAGDRLLLYVNRTAKGKTWEVFGCGRSRQLEDAGDDLMYLNALPESAKRTRISGTIRHYENTPEKGFSLIKYVGGVKVKIIGEKKSWDVYTDDNGVYEIYDLPPGKYKIEPEIPDSMKIRFGSWFGSMDYSVKDNVRFDLQANSCAGSDFVFSANNSIKGKVLSVDGLPIPNVCLALIPADISAAKVKSYFSITGCTKKDGSYELKEMPPGRYLIAANEDEKLSGTEPFPTTYYPGFFEKERAAVITIGQGESIERLDLHIPSQAETVVIQGVLTFSDGRPAPGEAVQFKASQKENNRDLNASNLTDDQGRFSLTILKGTKGALSDSLYLYEGRFINCPAVEKLLEGKGQRGFDFTTSAIEIDGENDVKEVKLTFPFPHCAERKHN